MANEERADNADRPNPDTSPTLLQRALADDQEAWHRLYYLYRPLVIYWCARRGIHAGDADDVSQEVFRAAAASLGRFRKDEPGDTFRGWLRGITQHKIQQHYRVRQNQVAAAGGSSALDQLEKILDPQAGGSDPDDPAEQVSSLFRRGLDLVRSEFEDRTWQMFWRTVIDSRPTTDVAAEMNVGVATVRQARSRVLRRLKEEVGDLIQ